MLFNFLPANITIFLCFFFLFLVVLTIVFNNYLYKSCRNRRLRFALAIPTGVPITVANDAIEMLQLVADKAIKDLSK